jgi:hypothetical protein
MDLDKSMPMPHYLIVKLTKQSIEDGITLIKGSRVVVDNRFEPYWYVPITAEIVKIPQYSTYKIGETLIVHHMVAGEKTNLIEKLDNGDEIRKVAWYNIWGAYDEKTDIIRPHPGQVYCQWEQFPQVYVTDETFAHILTKPSVKDEKLDFLTKILFVHPFDEKYFRVNVGDWILVAEWGAYKMKIGDKKYWRINTHIIKGKQPKLKQAL